MMMRVTVPVLPSPVAARPPASAQGGEGRSPAQDRVPHLATNSLMVLLGSVFGNGLNYVFGIYLARALGPVEFGLYALGIVVFNILVLFAPLGLETAVMKFVSQEAGTNAMASVRRTIVLAAGVAAGCGLLLALCLASTADLLAREFFGKPDLARVLAVLAVGVPLVAVSTVLLSSIQALGQIRSMVLIRNAVEPVGKFILAGVAVAMGWGVMGVAGGMLVLFMGSLALSVHCLRVLTQLRFDMETVPGRREVGALLAFSTPLIISNLFGIVAPRSDVLAIGAYGASSDVAVYAVAFQTAAVLALILGAFDAAMIPTIGGLLAQRDGASLKEASQAASRWALVLSLSVFVQFALFGADILRLFGPAFESGAVCLVILAAGHVLNSAAASSTGIILMSGHSKILMTISIVVGIALIGSNLFLVPRWGIVGAASATSFCIVASGLLCVLGAKRVSGIIPYTPGHLKPLGAAVVALATGFLFKGMFADASALWLAPLVAVFYCGALLAMGLTDSDHRALASLFSGAEPVMRALSIRGRAGR